MRTVLQVIGLLEKAPGIGSGVGEVWDLSSLHWLAVYSQFLPTFDVCSDMLLDEENVAFRGEVELGGNEKAWGWLHVEM